jgi:hypothetical protein
MMKTRFEGELAGLPPEVAAELEDHLLSRLEGHLAAGCNEEEARRRTLEDFGDLRDVAGQMTVMTLDPVWGRRRVPRTVRWLVGVWAGFGLACLGRLCTHVEPTYVTISSCLVVGLTSCAMALGLLRLREMGRRWMVGYLAGVAVVMGLSAFAAGQGGVVLPFAVGWFPVLFLVAAVSVWVLNLRSVRESFF